MDIANALNILSRMFPSVPLADAAKQAQKTLQGTPDNLQDAARLAASLGLDKAAIDALYDKYGRSMQARTVCSILGTTPEAIKADADNILKGRNVGRPGSSSVPKTGTTSRKFPRL